MFHMLMVTMVWCKGMLGWTRPLILPWISTTLLSLARHNLLKILLLPEFFQYKDAIVVAWALEWERDVTDLAFQVSSFVLTV